MDHHILSLRTDDVKGAIESSIDIQTFVSKFKDGFADMPLYLKGRLIDNMESVSVVKEETEIGQNVFRRLESIPLIDKYQAYQILDDNWSEVSVDFDIISTEGKDSIKVVDPNMVAKKIVKYRMDGKEEYCHLNLYKSYY